MFCPRCGTENQPGDRFCSSCGAALAATQARPEDKPNLGERLGRVVGTDRRTRLITAATILALAIAVIAFIALDSDDEIPRDDYTVAADERCVAAKRELAAARVQGVGQDVQALAADLVPIVVAWRSDFRADPVPDDRLEEAQRLDSALQDVEIEIASLARTDPGSRRQAIAQAGRVDRAATAVEEAIADLNLENCERMLLGITPGKRD